jgi:hypothetical protein
MDTAVWWNFIIPGMIGYTHGFDFILPATLGIIFSGVLYAIANYKKENPWTSMKNTVNKAIGRSYKKSYSQAAWTMDG